MNDFYLSVSLHSFYGPSWQLEAEGESLYWVYSQDGRVMEEKRDELTTASIEAFIRECDDNGIFSWEPHYLHCCMLDGATWTVHLRYRGYSFRSAGTNGYPDNWFKFCELLSKLASLGRNPCETTVLQVDNRHKP
jgi:hypothetical protein